jgi:hypothetical protein
MLVRLLLVLAVLGLLLAGTALWLRRALPQIAAGQIGRLLNAQVEVGACDLRRDGSVCVVDMTIRPQRQRPLHDDSILSAEKVYARFSRRSLLRLSPQVTDIRVDGFTLDAQLDLGTGQWNISGLRFNRSRGGGGDIPSIRLQRGRLRYSKIAGVQTEIVMSIPIEASFGRATDGSRDYSFVIRTAKISGGYGDSNLTGRWTMPVGQQPGRLELAGGLSSTDIPSLERVWAVDLLAVDLTYGRNGDYTLKSSLKNVHGKQAPEVDMLRYIVPAAAEGSGLLQNLQKFFATYQPTGIVAGITIQASGNIHRPNDSRIEGRLVCEDISACDRGFPYQLDHLRGEVEFTQSSLRVNGLAGKHGPVDVNIVGSTHWYSSGRIYSYRVTSRNMVLDKDLYAALTPGQMQLWDTFRPTGTVAVDYRLTRTSPTERRLYLSVDLVDVDAAFQSLPYPLAGLTGNLFFDQGSTTITDVVSRSSGRQIRLNGKLTNRSGERPVYSVSVDAQGIPLDATLRDALPTRHRELFQRFDVNGVADIRGRVFTLNDANGMTDPNKTVPVSYLADVVCRQGSVRLPAPCPEPSLPGAPAPADAAPAATGLKPPAAGPPAEGAAVVLSNITAQATITPDSLSIHKLDGWYGRSPVALTAGIRFGAGKELRQCHVEITGQGVPLDGALIRLLPSSVAPQAAAFHFEGDADLTVQLQKADSNRPPEYSAVVDCLGNRINHDDFPYPLEDIRGTLVLTKEGVVLKNIQARPQAGSMPAAGRSETAPATGSLAASGLVRIDGKATVARGRLEQGSFTVQAADLLFTEAFGQALPKTLAGLYRELSLRGPFGLDRTKLEVSRRTTPGSGTGAAEEEILVEFAGTAHLGLPLSAVVPGSPLKRCRLKASGTALELCGTVEAEGAYSTKHGLARAQARLAARQIAVRGKAVTDLTLSAAYDPNAQRWAAKDFVGNCYGGRVLGSLEAGPVRTRGPTAEAKRHSELPTSSSRGFEYLLQLVLHDVDLQPFLQAGRQTDGPEPPASTSSGAMDAWLSLRTRAAGPPGPDGAGGASSRQGVCRVDIANMRVGKVSPLSNVLSVLRLNEPSEYTFERMSIESYIQSDTLLISKLDLSGPSAAFTGSGTMDLPSEELNLMLTARGRRVAAAEPSVLQSLTEGLGGAVVRMEVTGKIGNPRVQTKALPLLEDSLRILGAPEEGRRAR